MIRFLTAGESHGPELTGIIEGVPAGFTITKDFIDSYLQRRQKDTGSGGFPWVLIASSLSLWLKEEGLSRSTIGWAGLRLME